MDTSLYSQVSAELSAGNYDEGLWLQMLAKNKGDEKKAHAAYISARLAELARQAKAAGHDARPPLEGIKGWLRVYWILVYWIWPFMALGYLGNAIASVRSLPVETAAQRAQRSEISLLVVSEALVFLALAGWGHYIGSRLRAIDNSRRE